VLTDASARLQGRKKKREVSGSELAAATDVLNRIEGLPASKDEGEKSEVEIIIERGSTATVTLPNASTAKTSRARAMWHNWTDGD
jgi:hypothetical protein